jgi:hypothetical protein
MLKQWNADIIHRDGYQCTCCGNSDLTKLQAHHHVPFQVIKDQLLLDHGSQFGFNIDSSNFSEFATWIKDCKIFTDTDNGTTLCDECRLSDLRLVEHSFESTIYSYYATVTEVHDGDTFAAELDLGFNLTHKVSIRLFGVNTAELHSADVQASTAKQLMNTLCVPGRRLVVRTQKPEKFGRWLGVVWLPHTTINDALLNVRVAVELII